MFMWFSSGLNRMGQASGAGDQTLAVRPALMPAGAI